MLRSCIFTSVRTSKGRVTPTPLKIGFPFGRNPPLYGNNVAAVVSRAGRFCGSSAWVTKPSTGADKGRAAEALEAAIILYNIWLRTAENNEHLGAVSQFI